jgi:hypothetical protein
VYKAPRGKIARGISTHLEDQSLLPAGQKRYHPGSRGFKDQLMISKAICEDCKRRGKSISITWTDWQKTLDCVLHS